MTDEPIRDEFSVNTPGREEGPFSEAEVRAFVRSYRSENGDEATLRDVTVVRLPRQSVGTGTDVEVRDFF
jgi:hypothetical protein